MIHDDRECKYTQGVKIEFTFIHITCKLVWIYSVVHGLPRFYYLSVTCYPTNWIKFINPQGDNDYDTW